MEPKGGGNGGGEGGSAEAAVPEAAPSAATQPSGTAAAERRDSADRWQRNREIQLQIPPAQRLPVTSQRVFYVNRINHWFIWKMLGGIMQLIKLQDTCF